MRLHQAYPLYTAGEREWAISGKKPKHLKEEVVPKCRRLKSREEVRKDRKHKNDGGGTEDDEDRLAVRAMQDSALAA